MKGIYTDKDLLTRSASPSESDNERLSDILETAQFGSLEGLDDEGDDLEDGAATQTASIRTKNEAAEDLGPVDIPNVSINENAVIERLGTTEKIMGTVAIVRAHTGGEYRVLDEGAVVVTETRNVVGVVHLLQYYCSYVARYQRHLALSNNRITS
jgi:hypothetical protein